MDHNEIRHKLSELIDGSLSPEEQAAVDAHLETCAACRDALTELRKTIEQVKAIEDIDPPAWMTGKIMANVRAEAEKKVNWLDRLLAYRLPLQTVAVLFLAIGAFYIYRNIQPSERLPEASQADLAMKQEAAPALKQEKKAEQPRAAVPAAPQAVPQKPQYKALDMKLEYEKPAPPVPLEERTPAPARAAAPKAAVGDSSGGSGYRTTRQDSADSMTEKELPAPAAAPQAAAVGEASAARKTAKAKDAVHGPERVIVERYPNGQPKLIRTYREVSGKKLVIAEECFDDKGLRDGLQKEFYETGALKTEAQYGQGKLEWYREYLPDGVKAPDKKNHDWIWLKE